MQYSASFDVRDYRHGFGSVTFSCAGSPDFSVDVAAMVSQSADGARDNITVFNHYAMNQFTVESGGSLPALGRNIASLGFPELVTQRMRDDSGWPDTAQLVCEYNGTNYTFRYNSHAFTAITFAGVAVRRLFGFTGDFSGSSDAVTGTGVPNFIVQPILSAVSMENADGFIYEPAGISAAVINVGGSQFGLTRTNVPIYRDWFQQSETRRKVLRESAVTTHPCTHQLIFESCRSVHPFLVLGGFDDGFDYLCKLRPEASMWTDKTCRRAGGEMDDALFDVAYRAQVLASAGIA